MENNDFQKNWLGLSEFLRRRRLIRAYKVIKPIAKKQLEKLSFVRELNDQSKDVGHIYLFGAVEDFWDNVEVIFLMGKNKKLRNFVFYPVRACMETRMRFAYFCKQNQINRNMIATKEILRIYFNLYSRDKLDGLSGEENARKYEAAAIGVDVPSIDKVSRGQLDPFPDMKTMCAGEDPKDNRKLYFLYSSFLCESTHGKTIAVKMRKQGKEFELYRRATMLLIPFCKEMLVLVDKFFFKEESRAEIEACIKDVNELMMGRLSLYEGVFSSIKKLF